MYKIWMNHCSMNNVCIRIDMIDWDGDWGVKIIVVVVVDSVFVVSVSVAVAVVVVYYTTTKTNTNTVFPMNPAINNCNYYYQPNQNFSWSRKQFFTVMIVAVLSSTVHYQYHTRSSNNSSLIDWWIDWMITFCLLSFVIVKLGFSFLFSQDRTERKEEKIPFQNNIQ